MRITPSQREYLKKPLGKVAKDTKGISREKTLVCIGDLASKRLLIDGFKPDIVVYDGKTRRENIGVADEIKAYEAKEYKLKNPQGELSDEAYTLFKKILKEGKPAKVYVEGEEDLTALAAISEAPDGSVVIYGQPDEGLVVVDVGKEVRVKIEKIIKEMK